MWTVVYIAANRAHAEMLKNLLCSEGILANTDRPAYQILVTEFTRFWSWNRKQMRPMQSFAKA